MSLQLRRHLFYQERLEEELQACTLFLADVLDRPRPSLFERFLGTVSIGNRVLLFTIEDDWIHISRVSRESRVCAFHAFQFRR